jgi:hypothetical protein
MNGEWMSRCLGTLPAPRHFWHPTNSLTRRAYMNARMRSAICCRHRGHVLTASAHSEHTHTCPHGRSSVVRCAFMQITHSLLTLLTLPRISAAPSADRLPSLPVSLPLGGWREDSGSYTGDGRAGGLDKSERTISDLRLVRPSSGSGPAHACSWMEVCLVRWWCLQT